MKKIGLFYFSGTGNTEIVSRLLRDKFEEKQIEAELFPMDAILKNRVQVHYEAFDLIGVGHPVLGFGASNIVEKFVEGLPPGNGKKAFVFKTASSPHYVNHGASHTVIKLMKRKGYEVFHNSILAMPCNWFLRYDDSMNKQLYETAVKKVVRLSDEIVNPQPRVLKINPLLSGVWRVIYYFEEHLGAKYFSMGLNTTEACNLCQKCVRGCPADNISENQGVIHFSTHCVWCMRCIYTCPQKAIMARHLSFCVLKPYTGGFNIDTILNNSTVQGNFVTEKSRGYYKHFIKYFNEGL